MNHEYAKIAVEGREEMAFWPLVTAALLFSQRGDQILFAATLVLAFTGTISYIELRRLRTTLQNARSKSSTYNRNSRKGVRSGRVDNLIEEIGSEIPEKTLLSWFIVVINVLIGSYLFYLIGAHLAEAMNPELLEIGLFILPWLYLATIVWAILFK